MLIYGYLVLKAQKLHKKWDLDADMDGDDDNNDKNNKNNKHDDMDEKKQSCFLCFSMFMCWWKIKKKTEDLYRTIGSNKETAQRYGI